VCTALHRAASFASATLPMRVPRRHTEFFSRRCLAPQPSLASRLFHRPVRTPTPLAASLSPHRYGSSISTDVRASVCNPWLAVTAANIFLLLAWVLSPQRWARPYVVNAAYVALSASMMIIMDLVHLNLEDLKVLVGGGGVSFAQRAAVCLVELLSGVFG
jgi:hypothetical protein